MDSAFGIDHGDISKAARPPRSVTAQKIGRLVRTGSMKASTKGNRAVNTPLSISGLGRAVGRGTSAAGIKIAGAGGTLQAHGGKTGAAVLGAGAGAGAYGYKRALDRKPPKKNKVPKGIQ